MKTYEKLIEESPINNKEFVVKTAKDILEIELTQENLWDAGYEINETEIRNGDLVFFEMNGVPHSYVGICTHGQEFVHMGVSGLTESSLKDDRWDSKFDGARRIMG